jgi:hypothetical protein
MKGVSNSRIKIATLEYIMKSLSWSMCAARTAVFVFVFSVSLDYFVSCHTYLLTWVLSQNNNSKQAEIL